MSASPGPAVAPGPKSFLGLRTFPGFQRGAARIYRHVDDANRYGDVVRYDVGRVVAHVLRHPDDIKHVLQENHANYIKGRGLRKLKIFLGEGLLTSEGAHWLRQRRLIQPAFHRARLDALVTKMVRATETLADEWSELAARGETIDVSREMMRLTLEIASTTLFSVSTRGSADKVGKALSVALREAVRRTFAIVELPLRVPTPRNVAYREAMRSLDAVVYGIIAERRKRPGGDDDLLSMLIETRDEATDEAMTDAQLRDEVMTLFLAGHETTANQLAWTFYLLSKHPAERRRLEAEVDAVLGDCMPTFEDLSRLIRIRMTIDESMRIFPPVWLFGRTALDDDLVRGYRIPKGSFVGVSPYLLHRHPSYWKNPEGFDPDRFDASASAGRHKYAYLPFGGGPRVCIGNHFAIMEAQVVLAILSRRFRVELAPGARVEPEPLVTLRPKGGIAATLARRHAVDVTKSDAVRA
jgi:cytochrome P450